MATKKKAAKKKAAKKKTSKSKAFATIDLSMLRFNPKWFTDPGPDFNARVLQQINQLKADFARQFNAIVKRG